MCDLKILEKGCPLDFVSSFGVLKRGCTWNGDLQVQLFLTSFLIMVRRVKINVGLHTVIAFSTMSSNTSISDKTCPVSCEGTQICDTKETWILKLIFKYSGLRKNRCFTGAMWQSTTTVSQCSRSVLEKPVVSQLLKTFHVFFGLECLLLCSPGAHRLTLSWTRPVYSTLFPPLKCIRKQLLKKKSLNPDANGAAYF